VRRTTESAALTAPVSRSTLNGVPGTGRIALAAVIAISLAACSSSSGSGGQASPYSGPPFATVTSTSGALQVAVRLSQQPPAAGNLEAQLTITSMTGNTPVDGLELQMVPYMPQMHHGTSVTPEIMAEGGGKYLVTNLYLFMPGIWELKTTVTGAKADSVDPQFEVQ